MEPVVRKVRAELADTLFGEGEETLASVVLKTLIAGGMTVSLAESCTAGLAASKLAEVPGASAALMGGVVVYSNESKVRSGVHPETLTTHGAVSAETARELAEGVRARFGTTFGISITGIAGPDGGTPTKPVGLVFVGIASELGTQSVELRIPGTERNMIRERTALAALNLLRRLIVPQSRERVTSLSTDSSCLRIGDLR